MQTEIPFFPFTPSLAQTSFYNFLNTSISTPYTLSLAELNTGGGKTLISVCAALNQKNRKILYVTRTFAEITNVIAQLKKIPLDFSATFLASKEKICINPQINTQPNISNSCSKMYKNCPFYTNSVQFQRPGIVDLEDFSAAEVCPFYAGRAMAKQVQVVVCSYNYLFDTQNTALNDFGNRTIVIIDEAHNVPKVASQSFSASFAKGECEKCEQDLRSIIGEVKVVGRSVYAQFLYQLVLILGEIKVLKQVGESHVFDVIFEANRVLSGQKYDKQVLLEGSRMFMQIQQQFQVNITQEIVQLAKFASILSFIHLNPSRGYQFALTVDYPFIKFEDSTELVLSSQRNILELSCLDASMGLEKVVKSFENIVFMSGTLKDFNITQKILGLDRLAQNYQFKLKMYSGYQEKNFRLYLLTHGIYREEINLNFNNRFDKDTIQSTVKVLQIISNSVSDGILIFFPSFAFLETFVAFQQLLDIKLQGNRLIFFETNNALESLHALNSHKIACDMGRGSIFCAVSRGSFAEGIDIGNQYGRLVIIIGVPYMFRQSARIQAQIKFYQGLDISEQEYIEYDALQITQQAVGRICRKQSEYGCIIFLESRFKPIVRKLDNWVKSKGYKETNTRQIVNDIRGFLLEQALMVQNCKD